MVSLAAVEALATELWPAATSAVTAVADPRKGQREVYFPETGFAPCTVYNRYALRPGMEVPGPAVIEERESTTVVGPDAVVTIDRFLNLIIEIESRA